MKLRLSASEQDEEIDLTPMIDCVFLLVLFFMVTSSFIEEAKVFKIVLPRADRPTAVAREDADSVSLTVDGKLYYRAGAGRDEEISGLAEVVERLQARPEPRPVIVRCDARCEYRQFVEVKNALRSAGVATIFEEVDVRDASPQP